MKVTPDQNRLVIGVGGTGRSHILRSWSEEANGQRVRWASGSARRFVSLAKVVQALDDKPDTLVLDELQWFTADALEALADVLDLTDGPTILASRRPWPITDTLSHISSVLSETNPPTTTGFLTHETLRPVLARMFGGPVKADVSEWVFAKTLGSVGLAADIVASKWHNVPDTTMPDQLTFLINQRLQKGTKSAEQLALLLTLDPGAASLPALVDEDSNAEHQLRSSGLVTADLALVPLVSSALENSMTHKTRSKMFDSLALSEKDPTKAADFALKGSLTDRRMADILDRAAVELWWSEPQRAFDYTQAADRLDDHSDRRNLISQVTSFRLGNTQPDAGSPLAVSSTAKFTQAVRDMRWAQADVHSDARTEPLLGLMRASPNSISKSRSTEDTTKSGLVRALGMAVDGKANESIALFAAEADDYDRITKVDPDDQFLLAFTPHRVGAFTALALGDSNASRVLVRQAMQSPSIAPDELRTFKLFDAYLKLLAGDFAEALAATGDTAAVPTPEWSFRDQLLWSSLNAGLARRSGDTTRLREAWRAAEAVVLQVSPSWLYLEPLHDLLVAGARLGQIDRIQPVIEELDSQASEVGGEIPANIAWLKLHVALVSNAASEVTKSAETLTETEPTSRRNIARQRASSLWSKVAGTDAGNNLTETAVTECADQVAESGDPWQASRLLGQAALDQEDPKAAKRLLEKARDVITEIGQATTNDFGKWGLSDREAEVARLVGEGHAYKQIGQRLYISPKTVEHHVAKIRQKLGASSRAEMLKKINSCLVGERTGKPT